jgi:hypothetical protein
MNIRVNIAAIFLVFVQVICVQLVSAEQSSNSTALTAAIQQDAIQQFVQGDFAQRRALLKQWPGSIEQLDQLAEYVENEQLYSGANGQTYILERKAKKPKIKAMMPGTNTTNTNDQRKYSVPTQNHGTSVQLRKRIKSGMPSPADWRIKYIPKA